VHEGGNMCVNKWIALLSRTILRENRVICENRVLEVKSMHDLGFDVLDVILLGKEVLGMLLKVLVTS